MADVKGNRSLRYLWRLQDQTEFAETVKLPSKWIFIIFFGTSLAIS